MVQRYAIVEDNKLIFQKELPSITENKKFWDLNEVTETRSQFIEFLKSARQENVNDEQLKELASWLRIGWCEVVPLDKAK